MTYEKILIAESNQLILERIDMNRMNREFISDKLAEIEKILLPVSEFPKNWDVNTKAKIIYAIQSALSETSKLRIELEGNKYDDL